MKEVSEIAMRLVNIEILAKIVRGRPANFEDNFFTFNIKAETKISQEKKYVLVFLSVSIIPGDGEEPIANYKVVTIFEFPEFDEMIKLNEQNEYAIPTEVDQFCKSIAISTTRGIIYSELKGTYLHNAIMPLVNIDSLYTNPDEVKAT